MNELIINKEDLLCNINQIKNHVTTEDYTIIAVVKGNGYGLGAYELVKVLIDNNIKNFAVAAVNEAIELKKAGIKEDILLLTPVTDKETVSELIDNNIILTVDSENSVKVASEVAREKNKKVRAHVKIDTGLARYGFNYNKNEETKNILKKYDYIDFEGIFSHFSNSLAADSTWSNKQYERLCNTIDELEKSGLEFKLKHICNSSGFFKYPNMHLNAARIGSAFNGMASGPDANLKRIGTFHTKIERIREVEKGEFIGYANSYVAKRKMKIAILPTGYYEGIGRDIETQRFKFKSKFKKLIMDFKNLFKDDTIYLKVNGQTLEVVGQIGMHDIVLDITNKDFEENDDLYIDIRPVLIDSSIKRLYK